MFLHSLGLKCCDHSFTKSLIAAFINYKFIQPNADLFYTQQFLLHLGHLVSKFFSGILQEVMFGIPYSYCKVKYSKMTSTNNFEDILPDAISYFDNDSRLSPCTDLFDKCQDLPSNTQ